MKLKYVVRKYSSTERQTRCWVLFVTAGVEAVQFVYHVETMFQEKQETKQTVDTTVEMTDASSGFCHTPGT